MSGSDSKQGWNPAFVSVGFLSLLGAAYLDSIRGPLIPLFHQQFGIPYDRLAWFLTAGNITALFVLALLNPALKHFGEKRTGVAVFLAIAGLGLGAPFVGDFSGLILLGIGLGGGIATIGALCNIFALLGTPAAWRTRVLTGTHFMYGVGSFAGPLIAVATLSWRGWPWLVGYGSLFFLGLSLLAMTKLPPLQTVSAPEDAGGRATLVKAMVIGVLAFYVVGEVMSAMWLVTYLHGTGRTTLEQASEILSQVFLVMAITRVLCLVLIRPSWEKVVLWGSLILPLVAHVLGRQGGLWAYPLIGCFGPFFPVFLARVSHLIPHGWRPLTVKVSFVNQGALALTNILLGYLTRVEGVGTAYLVPPIFFLGALLMLGVFFQVEARKQDPILSS